MSNNQQKLRDGYQPRPSENPSKKVKGGYQPNRSEGDSPTNPPPKRK